MTDNISSTSQRIRKIRKQSGLNMEGAEKAFLNVMKNNHEKKDKKKANFYGMIYSLLLAYLESDRDTQGYLSVQLKKTFSKYIKE